MLKGLFSRKNRTHSIAVLAPVTGEVLPLEQVPDPVFSQKLAGEGVAIRPAEGRLVSPVDGQVIILFDTGHAVGIRSREGVELLLHIGIDTVRLKGRGFRPRVKTGDAVKVGDVLVEFDRAVIEAAGCSPLTPVVVTNREQMRELRTRAEGQVRAGVDQIMDIRVRSGE